MIRAGRELSDIRFPQVLAQPLRRLPVHMNEEVDKQIDEMLKEDVIQ